MHSFTYMHAYSLIFLLNYQIFVYAQEITTTIPYNISDTEPTKPPLFPNAKKWYNPEVFSRLTLPANALFGSRWIMENKEKMNVSFSIEIADVTLIHNNELTLRIEFNLRQMWDATGLEFPEGLFKPEDPDDRFVTADYDVLKFMWSPDSYVSSSRESNMNTVDMPLSLVYIFKNMSIIYKVRMFTKVSCSSSFQWYPMDIQSCHLVIESYKYHDDVVDYNWTPDHLYRPVVIHTKRLFQYELKLPLYYDSGTIERGGRGKRYPFVRVKFTFERKLGNNIIQVYTPTTLVVVLSWFSFWLGLDAIPGRISLLVTCMLTLVTMHSGIKSSIPPVHYITMMDVWLVYCMASVFSAMCEFVVVKYLHWRQTQKQKRIDKKLQEENREKLYSIMQQFGGTSGPGVSKDTEGGGGGQVKIKEGLLPFATEKQNSMNMFWSANQSSKIMPVDILRSVMVEAVTREHHRLQNDIEKENEENEKMDQENGTHFDDTEKGNNEESGKMLPIWVRIDRFCRICFPSLFGVFNFVYWPVLFCGSEDQDNYVYG